MLQQFQRKSEKEGLQTTKNVHLHDQIDQVEDGGPLKELYVCFCKKQYKSFPAFYLHTRRKHEICIRKAQKADMKVSLMQNGRNKMIVYESKEEDLKRTSQEIEYPDMVPEERVALSSLRKSRSEIEKVELPNTLKLFLATTSRVQMEIKPNTTGYEPVQFLIKFLYSQFTQKMKKSGIVRLSENLEALPLFLNSFMIDFVAITEIVNLDESKIKRVLLDLSIWLFYSKQSPTQQLRMINDEFYILKISNNLCQNSYIYMDRTIICLM